MISNCRRPPRNLNLTLEKEYQAAGGFSFGNVANVENFTSPEEKIMSDTEKRYH